MSVSATTDITLKIFTSQALTQHYNEYIDESQWKDEIASHLLSYSAYKVLMERIGEERAMKHTIRKRQRKWIGPPYERSDPLLSTVIEGKWGGEAEKRKTKTVDDDRWKAQRGGGTLTGRRALKGLPNKAENQRKKKKKTKLRLIFCIELPCLSTVGIYVELLWKGAEYRWAMERSIPAATDRNNSTYSSTNSLVINRLWSVPSSILSIKSCSYKMTAETECLVLSIYPSHAPNVFWQRK